MNLEERLNRLEPRERRLLGVLVTIFAVLVLLAVPVAVRAVISSKRSTNEQLHGAIDSIQNNRDRIWQQQAKREAILARYSRVAPPLAGFLAKLASETQIEIPESQDRATVPQGKKYEERSTKIVLRKVGMLNLVKLMEKIEQSGHPVTISRLNIRKRAVEPDSYDVELTVSAFDHKATEAAPKKGEGTPREEQL